MPAIVHIPGDECYTNFQRRRTRTTLPALPTRFDEAIGDRDSGFRVSDLLPIVTDGDAAAFDRPPRLVVAFGQTGQDEKPDDSDMPAGYLGGGNGYFGNLCRILHAAKSVVPIPHWLRSAAWAPVVEADDVSAECLLRLHPDVSSSSRSTR